MVQSTTNGFVIDIIESEIGPLISQSRATVYDVMEAYDEGYHPSEIGRIYNLSPHQVQIALAYIAAHRGELEPKLKEILKIAAEREQTYRMRTAEIERQHPLPLTPQHLALQALIEQNRRARGEL
jgi:uncharacterized protein (DUF433 family)